MIEIENFILRQAEDRQQLLKTIHGLILVNDPTVEAKVGSMMGKEMVLYNDRGVFKYGLASTKDYLSLHLLPMYANAPLHAKYQALLPKAKFQKGCINFKIAEDMPVAILAQLMGDCSKIDMIAIREAYLLNKKKK